MSKVIISDTSCLIALDRIKKLEILKQIFTTVIVTPEIRSEFGRLPEWIIIKEVTNLSRQNHFEISVDKGEASSIALALETPNSILIIDEKKGRGLAQSLHLEIIGTLKVLLLAKQKGIISSIKPLLAELDHHNFRFSKFLVKEVLIEAQEYL